MHKYCPLISTISGFILICCGIIGSWRIFPAIIKSEIHKSIDLVEGTYGYRMWQKQPFPLQFKIYLFNVTNPHDVQTGADPIVKEIGPYVYDEYREKVDVTVDEERDLLKYILRKNYFFNQKDSGSHKQDDTVTILNAALVGTAMQVNLLLPTALPLVTEALPYLFPESNSIFITAKVNDLLFDGIRIYCQNKSVEVVCGAMKTSLPKIMTVAENGKDFMFSMFSFLNGTDDGPWEMGRGLKNTTRGEVHSYMNEEILDIWNDKYCNQLNGSDSTVFEPVDMTQPRQERLYTFAQDFCRSLYASFEKESEEFGLPCLRYTTKEESLANNKENECFCPISTDDNGDDHLECPPTGIADVTACLKAPVLISYPHFYMGDKKLRQYVSGLDPQKDLHENYVNLEPRTGTPLSGRKRIQMNIELKQLEGFPLLENVSRGIFPILWIEEGVRLPNDVADFLVSNLKRAGYLDTLKWALILCGSLLLTFALIITLKREEVMCFSKHSKVHATSVQVGVRHGEVNNGYDHNPSLYPQIQNKNMNVQYANRGRSHQWNVA